MEIRCQRGSQISLNLGFSVETAEAIRNLDEHWDGEGYPKGLHGGEIPILARILNLAQTLEVFAGLNGPADAFRVLRERSGTWFDPGIVDAVAALEQDAALWECLQDGSARGKIIAMQPEEDPSPADELLIDNICTAFADVVDAKSPYTFAHSKRVTAAAIAIGAELGFAPKDMVVLRRAALLHDIGKLSVPNSILDKPGKLTAIEWETVRLHPYYTQRILEKIPGFAHIAFIASTHHEKLDGTGYYRDLRATQLPMETRALVVADIFDALSSARAYRDALPLEKVFEIMSHDVPHALDINCFEALKKIAPSWVSQTT